MKFYKPAKVTQKYSSSMTTFLLSKAIPKILIGNQIMAAGVEQQNKLYF